MKVDDTVGPLALSACESLAPGEIVVLENVRFNAGEKKGDVGFASKLAALADCYVNDAFGTCHRDEASMVAVPEQFPPEGRAIGFLVEKELRILETLLASPKHPYMAVMGGAKVSDKITLIENLSKRVDKLLIGGAMTYTFLKAMGIAVGKSKVEADKLDVAKGLLELLGDKLVLAQGPPGRQPAGGRRGDQGGRGRGNSGRLVRDGHRAGDDRRVIVDHQGSRDGGVERADGHVRSRVVRRGDQGDRGGARRFDAVTAVGGGESAEAVEKVRAGRAGVARLDGRRSFSRVARG